MRVVMMGTGTFAEPTFEALVVSRHDVVGLVTQPDRAVGERRGSTRQVGKGMKEIAGQHGIPVFQPESINTPEGVATLQSLKPDLLAVAAYGQILSKDVLSTASLGGVNVHASLLPKYRGAAPIAWAIWQGETETGVCIIRMTIGLDAGDVLSRGVVTIDPNETAGELEARLGPLGAGLAIDVINRLESGPVAGQPQDKSLVSKAPKLTKEMGLIDWSKPAATVLNQIRAMQPWPTPYSFLRRDGQSAIRIVLPKARIAETPGLAPGLIKTDGKSSLAVGCGDSTAIEILEIQPAGKKRMPIADYLRGANLTNVSFGSDPEASVPGMP